MQIEEQKRLHRLEAGQLWKIEHGYVYIVELGKQLIHYKLMRQPSQRAVLTRMIGIEALLNYLRQSEAELVSCSEVSHFAFLSG
jgi:hypothetical protein